MRTEGFTLRIGVSLARLVAAGILVGTLAVGTGVVRASAAGVSVAAGGVAVRDHDGGHHHRHGDDQGHRSHDHDRHHGDEDCSWDDWWWDGWWGHDHDRCD